MRSSPSRQAELARLIERPFAHRGLHGSGRIENSRAAFRAAIDAGHGIELDVQASLCGFAFVFHDSRLDRLTDQKGALADRPDDEIGQIRLKGSNETIARLDEILALIAGRVPVLIEVKAQGPAFHQLCHHVSLALHGYDGPIAIMSFNPRVGRWFARHSPHWLRGLVVTEQGKPERHRLRRRFALWWSRPDFLAYDIRDLPSRFAAGQRARGLKVLTWTCRSEAHRSVAAEQADQIIYETAE